MKEIRGAILEVRIKLERILRAIMEDQGFESDELPIRDMLKTLKDNGIIDIKTYDLALTIQQVGNRAAHGDVQNHDRAVAEEHIKRLENNLIIRGLIENKIKREPTFEELFLGRKPGESSQKNKNKPDDFGKIFDEFEREMSGEETPKQKQKQPVDIKPKEKKQVLKNEDDFSKLLDEFGDPDDEKE